MARVTVVKEDNVVIVDGNIINTCDLSGLASNIHAIQWDGSSGEIEYNDGTVNEAITSISDYQSIIDEHATKKAENDAEIAAGQLSDVDKLRVVRTWLLKASDWTQIPDSPLSESDKTAWSTYRTNLRNITDTYTSLDTVVWPTAPDNSLQFIIDSVPAYFGDES